MLSIVGQTNDMVSDGHAGAGAEELTKAEVRAEIEEARKAEQNEEV